MAVWQVQEAKTRLSEVIEEVKQQRARRSSRGMAPRELLFCR